MRATIGHHQRSPSASLYSDPLACQSRRRAGPCSASPWTCHGAGARPGGAALMVVLDGASLTIDSLAAVAERRGEGVLAPLARGRVAGAPQGGRGGPRAGGPVYGLTAALAGRK